jgi:hypothetical protein
MEVTMAEVGLQITEWVASSGGMVGTVHIIFD